MKWVAKVAMGATFSVLCSTVANAEIKVGFVTSLSGSGASIGIPYSKGMAAAIAYLNEVGGERIRIIQLDDASDPSTAARDARKLITEDGVDVLFGTSSATSTLAMATVAVEEKVPMITLSPLSPLAAGEGGPWVISVPQPATLMIGAVVDRMRSQGLRRIAYIGFSDAWGDLVHDSLVSATSGSDITIVANERYGRADTSVTAQTLKMLALRPDAVMTGGSGTPGALPFLALADRGYRGPVFGMHSLINADFVRVGGNAVEGVICPSGPVVVAEQLPDANPSKSMSLEFRAAYQKANNAVTTDGFSPTSFDGWLIFLDAAKRSLPNGKPGTQEFRNALRQALFSTKEVVGTQGVYNFTPASNYGVDERSRVLVKLVKGNWQLIP